MEKIIEKIIEKLKNRKLPFFVLGLSIFLFFLIFSIAFYYFIGMIVHSKKEVKVPDITGKPLLEALDIVSNVGLGLKKIGEVYNPDYPAATVVVQQPRAGMSVRKGRFVNVILSLGGEKVFVPNIIGEERRKAEVLLKQYGLFLGTTTFKYSLKYEKNIVMNQNPLPESIVEKNSSVDIEVSLGLPPPGIVLIPDFTSKTVENVYDWTVRHNIEVKIEEKIVEEGEEGIVLSQNPPPDTQIIINEPLVLEITVSKTQKKSLKETHKEIYNFEYELPFIGESLKVVKIVQISDEGEHVLYNKPTSSKQKISLYVPPRRNSKLRIFVDGVLIDEK
ncbi:MAG: PASTA domain-containing protein [Endomicrobiia bacterium]